MTPGVLRSHLYVPADQERLLSKARSRGADALIIDLEDAVVPSRKDIALAAALEFLAEPVEGPERWVRVNGGERGLADIDAIAPLSPDGVWLPKAEPGEWFTEAHRRVTEAGLRLGILVESAAGIVGMPQLPPLREDTLAQLGEVDLAANLRMRDTSDEAMVPYRARIVMETAMRGLAPAVAPVDVRVDDPEGFRSRSTSLRDRGFGSRACIHPDQVAIANSVFEVDAADVELARATILEFEQHEAEGRGAFRTASGGMADLATIRWARDVIARADEVGL
jgi:citrate lyase subunit beta/citryl-CoA lyase